MKQSEIIVIINKKPYTLSATNTEAIRSIPGADRQQLITVLEAIKREEGSVQLAADSILSSQVTASTSCVSNQEVLPERLRNGDVDAVMAQLTMEEDLKKKPGLTKQTIHKWMAAVVVCIILLILIL